MRIFIFKSAAKSGLRAFAGEAGGQKLPTNSGPWHAIGVIREDKIRRSMSAATPSSRPSPARASSSSR